MFIELLCLCFGVQDILYIRNSKFEIKMYFLE